MKNFKNTFGVRSNSTPLLKAFMEAATQLGWTYQGDRELEECHPGLWFNSGPGSDIQDDHFWICDSMSHNPSQTVYTLPAQWDEALAAASEKNIPKEGDWVVVLPTDNYYQNAEQGKAQLVLGYRKDALLPFLLKFSDGDENSYREVRFATQEEIELAKKSYVIVHIAGGELGVAVYRDGSVRAAGENFNIGAIRELHRKLTKLTVVDSPWKIRVESVQVGCTPGITLADLSNILYAYEKNQE